MVEELSMNNTENVNIDEIPVVEATDSKFDAQLYEGYKTKIQNVEIQTVIDKYPGGVYTPESQDTKKVVVITTYPLPEMDENGNASQKLVEFPGDDGNTRNLQVNKRFNLQEKEGKIVISKHPKAALWKAMRKLGATQLSEMKEKIVILTTRPSKNPEDDRVFLDIVL